MGRFIHQRVDAVEISQTSNTQPLEETPEESCFNRFADELATPIERHPLACESCQRLRNALDRYISLRKAEFDLAAAARSRMPTGNIWSRVHDAWSRPSNPTWVIAVGSLSMIAVLSWAVVSVLTARRIEPAPPSAPVALTAVRGGKNFAMTEAPAGRSLDLAIDLTDLPSSTAYRLEVVSAQGQRVWEAHEPASNDKLSARLPKGLNPGVYWVRLYSAQDELLREFGLRLP